MCTGRVSSGGQAVLAFRLLQSRMRPTSAKPAKNAASEPAKAAAKTSNVVVTVSCDIRVPETAVSAATHTTAKIVPTVREDAFTAMPTTKLTAIANHTNASIHIELLISTWGKSATRWRMGRQELRVVRKTHCGSAESLSASAVNRVTFDPSPESTVSCTNELTDYRQQAPFNLES